MRSTTKGFQVKTSRVVPAETHLCEPARIVKRQPTATSFQTVHMAHGRKSAAFWSMAYIGFVYRIGRKWFAHHSIIEGDTPHATMREAVDTLANGAKSRGQRPWIRI